jgi:hypothetical protein
LTGYDGIRHGPCTPYYATEIQGIGRIGYNQNFIHIRVLITQGIGFRASKYQGFIIDICAIYPITRNSSEILSQMTIKGNGPMRSILWI